MRSTSPLLMFSPSSGSVKSVGILVDRPVDVTTKVFPPSWLHAGNDGYGHKCPGSADRRIDLLRVDLERDDCVLHHRHRDLSVTREGAERGDDHVTIIDLEEIAQRIAGLAASVAV